MICIRCHREFDANGMCASRTKYCRPCARTLNRERAREAGRLKRAAIAVANGAITRKCATPECENMITIANMQKGRLKFCPDCRLAHKREYAQRIARDNKSTTSRETNTGKGAPRWKRRAAEAKDADDRQSKLRSLMPRYVKGSDILHAPAERAAQLITDILQGRRGLAGG